MSQNASVVESLKKFRFIKKPEIEASTSLPKDSETPTVEEITIVDSEPEQQNNFEYETSNKSSKKKTVKVAIYESAGEDDEKSSVSSKSDSDCKPTKEVIEKSVVEKYSVADQENALKHLIDLFPKSDLLKLQDVLLHSNWDADVATEKLMNGYNKRHLASKERAGKKRRLDDDFEEERDDGDDDDGNSYESDLFDSDEESDDEIIDDLRGDKLKVFDFLNNANINELQLLQNLSKKRVELIIQCRPFSGWKDMVEKFKAQNGLSTEILNYVQDLLRNRSTLSALMDKCEKLANKLEKAVSAGLSNVKEQPRLLSKHLSLSDYQLVGLNWLIMMFSKEVNGILADEMGLGKTIQIIAFFAHLKDKNLNKAGKPHLVVVPASTAENWRLEMERWCPSLKVVFYHGSQEDRRKMRIKWIKHGFEDTDVVLTTYNMLNASAEERKMFRTAPLHYSIFDEAHMLKNMSTKRYEDLIKISAPHRILLTGTPLQNNLLELMSLLVFVMPQMFDGKQECLKALFAKNSKLQQLKNESSDAIPEFERKQIIQAKHIMKPFVLRRLKQDVLKELPVKTREDVFCKMTKTQESQYKELISVFKKQAKKIFEETDDQAEAPENGMAMYMKLRRLANHPLLLRYHFKDRTLKDMAKILQADTLYQESVFDYIEEDLSVMSDFELHTLAKEYKSCYRFQLRENVICQSGKFAQLDSMLPKLKEENHRVLIFSQFVIVLDILEEHLNIRGYKFLRLDGNTPINIRQELIDEYNRDDSIFIFILSTRAGGLGINLTAADTVIIHDVDPNPQNDKQAEDRSHRIGQTKPVKVMRLISEGTIEENIFNMAQEKLALEREMSSEEDNEQAEKKSVASLLKQALGLDKKKT